MDSNQVRWFGEPALPTKPSGLASGHLTLLVNDGNVVICKNPFIILCHDRHQFHPLVKIFLDNRHLSCTIHLIVAWIQTCIVTVYCKNNSPCFLYHCNNLFATSTRAWLCLGETMWYPCTATFCSCSSSQMMRHETADKSLIVAFLVAASISSIVILWSSSSSIATVVAFVEVWVVCGLPLLGLSLIDFQSSTNHIAHLEILLKVYLP